ncbi:DNA mismatch repair protein Msh2-like isoform X2 [Varroa jacobsoni]|uniref:DNA mismatch repair proteins mutS family domain-containing protein n=1 Tax=Varroa destructor TaxID=109461 RepID=A0A7M7JI88_VARDE|nr:DNA mismatch repair protein Msh2-like isoform X3 [Varroa destructor]XP_022697959.1 DNA mismatch repair protein Msh2-like isoform X2 [Varroa jacobsoni]
MVDVPQHATLQDVARDTNFIKFYGNLPSKPATTIRLFQRKNYYTVHDDDASLASAQLLKVSIVQIQGIPSAWISQKNYEKFLRFLLLAKAYRVEVYSLDAASGSWQVSLNASPGNLVEVEDVLFSCDSNEDVNTHCSGIAALHVTNRGQQVVVGLAYCEPILQSLRVAQLIDDMTLTKLQVLLVQISPKEMLIPTKTESFPRVTQLLKRNNIAYHELGHEHFNDKNLEQDIEKIYKFARKQAKNIRILPELKVEPARRPLAALLNYLNLASTPTSFGQFTIHELRPDQIMRIDSAAVEALNLLPVGDMAKQDTIYGLLCEARTPGGQRTLAEWMKQPLLDKAKIEERLDMVECFVRDNSIRSTLHGDLLRRFPDLSYMAKRLHMKKIRLADLYKLYTIVRSVPRVVEALGETNCGSLEDAVVKRLKVSVEDFEKFIEMIEQVIDVERAEAKREYLVQPSFDEALQELHEQIVGCEERLQELWDTVACEMRVEKGRVLKLDQGLDGGFVFRVTNKEEKRIRDNQSFDIIDVKKQGISFVNRQLRELNGDYIRLKNDYRVMQQTLVGDIIDVSAGYAEPLYHLAEVINQLDAVVGLSVAAVNGNFVRPNILESEGKELILKGVRHPLVERKRGSFVANDVHFERQNKHFHVLTGPNMGGKSTYMRSIAVCVVMAQMGSFVPCNEATIAIRDAVLTRVGAGDAIVRGVSTFLAEMLEIAFILRTVTNASLVLIDELGRGTSTYDGLGIAWAIASNLAQSGCMSIFATHFHELTALESRVQGVVNAHVSVHVEDQALTLLYKVAPGPCHQSFGIEAIFMSLTNLKGC